MDMLKRHDMDPIVASILDKALDGKELSVKDAIELFNSNEVNAIARVADSVRKKKVGDLITYVINRNINFTNVCIKRCGFCAFSRDFREEEGYFLPIEEIVRRAKEAYMLGATEVCIQAGLAPKMDGYLYIDICKAIKREVPDIHIHAYSPEEVLYGAIRTDTSVEDYLKMLKEAGLGSLPGTAAEILDQEIRDKISPGRISKDEWIRIIKYAHKLGIPTTSTIMYGHIEDARHRAEHLALIREIQKETRGFTEFVPLSFVYHEAPMYRYKLVDGIKDGPSIDDTIKMHAIARLMLNNIDNIQVSWVKEGIETARTILNAGANDLGGTLINESISLAAGSKNGQLLRPKEIRSVIKSINRIPAERDTTYKNIKIINDNHIDPLDLVDDTSRFGSYHELIKMDKFRFKRYGSG
ncbi:MAG: 5-amino-6-(D-ribitylamino)uracil--L-tyrosine 4-hydroxyphenyl transferase CofH [Candidatus Nitrosocaldaceae archaeon]